MVILIALLPFFLVAPLVKALKRGVQQKYILVIVALLLCVIIGSFFRVSTSCGGLLWIMATLISCLVKPDSNRIQKNKKLIFLIYVLAIVADCILVPLALSSYTH